MEFAREHLKQFGWQEGNGLGREQHGITEALKPKLKFDTAGIGHDPAKEFTHTWWSEAYNSAASSLTVTEASDGCQLGAKPKEKKVKKKKEKTAPTYANFVAGGMLLGDRVTGGGGSDGELEPEQDQSAACPSDAELLAACGGRTAHKGARHGHKMDGKLARVMAQEAALLAKLQTASTGEQTVAKKKKRRTDVDDMNPSNAKVDEAGEWETVSKKKKKKREQKEAVTVSTNDENRVSELPSTKKKKKKRKIKGEDTEQQCC